MSDFLTLALIVTFVVATILVTVACGLIIFVERRLRKDLSRLATIDEIEADVRNLSHRSKMLQGRLNAIAPPRAGTGAPDVAQEAAGDPTMIPAQYRSRASLLVEARARRRTS